jgi:hypothetical protein
MAGATYATDHYHHWLVQGGIRSQRATSWCLGIERDPFIMHARIDQPYNRGRSRARESDSTASFLAASRDPSKRISKSHLASGLRSGTSHQTKRAFKEILKPKPEPKPTKTASQLFAGMLPRCLLEQARADRLRSAQSAPRSFSCSDRCRS